MAADLATNTDIVLGDVTGFTFNLNAGRRLKWELRGVFSTGATGGFRFRCNSTAAPTTYNAEWFTIEETTPATFQDAQIAAADFTNASAVASNYLLWAKGNIIANADTVVSIQFAQNNSTANDITLRAGLTWELVQY